MKDAIKGIAAICGAILFLGLGCPTIKPASDDAVVCIDDSSREYRAPPCLLEQDIADCQWATLRTVRELGYESNGECVTSGAFMMEGRSFTGSLLEELGILGPLPNRWNPDGTWNW